MNCQSVESNNPGEVRLAVTTVAVHVCTLFMIMPKRLDDTTRQSQEGAQEVRCPNLYSHELSVGIVLKHVVVISIFQQVLVCPGLGLLAGGVVLHFGPNS